MTPSRALSGQMTEQLLRGIPPKPHFLATFLIPTSEELRLNSFYTPSKLLLLINME